MLVFLLAACLALVVGLMSGLVVATRWNPFDDDDDELPSANLPPLPPPPGLLPPVATAMPVDMDGADRFDMVFHRPPRTKPPGQTHIDMAADRDRKFHDDTLRSKPKPPGDHA